MIMFSKVLWVINYLISESKILAMRTKSGREIKRQVESYNQDCVMKATVMENARSSSYQKKNRTESIRKIID